jgi:DNA-binding GntR family transcriptional regulator
MSDTLTQKAYRHIHEKLSCGKLQPGSRLSNRGVAKEVGMSFTPVREALSRLVSEGLLEHRQGLGVFVPFINSREIREIYELREILESEAAAKVSRKPASDPIDEMAHSYELMADIYEQTQRDTQNRTFAGYATAWQAADSTFHVSLLHAAGNRRLLDIVEGLQTSLKAMMGGLQDTPVIVEHRFVSEPQEQIKRTLDEHQRILEALKTGDAKAAKQVMCEHIRSGLELALAAHNRSRMNGTKSLFHVHGPDK